MKTIYVVPIQTIENIIEKYPNEIEEDLELFISYDKERKKFIALDNTENCCFTEEFYSLSLAFVFLLGKECVNPFTLELIDKKSKCFKTRIIKSNVYSDSVLEIHFS